MLRSLLLFVFAVAVFTPVARAADATVPDGNWFLAFTPNSAGETRLAIFSTETKDGKTTFKTVDGGRNDWSATDLKVTGTAVTFKVVGPVKLSFEGIIDAKTPKLIAGNLGDDARLFMASLIATDEKKLEGNTNVSPKQSDEMKEVIKLRAAPAQLRAKARQEKDADKKKELLEEAAAATKVADEKIPQLLKTVVEKEAGTNTGFFVTLDLLNIAGKAKLKPDDVKKWVAAAREFAGKHGTRFEQDATVKIATTLAGQEGFGTLALALTEEALKKAEKAPATVQLGLLKAMASAQEKAGLPDAAKVTLAKIDVLESVADAEYRKTVPPFTPTKYAGRQEKKANKVAVLELFTGAQCPPCVAADVAFDALEKAYDHKDLVLIQYHMHIPGPDPLTNPTSIARWDFYRDKFENDIGGTPSTLFNGKPKAPGGGGMKNAAKKFDEYKGIIDDTLEKTSPYTITGSAALAGDKLTATVNVATRDKPDGDQMLRLLLVEEEVRYLGGNGLRLHHHVVRSQFDLKDGVKVKELKDGKHEVSLSIAKVQKDLKTYLDDYSAQRPFPNSDRPTALKKLKVIAFVQDDLNGEISQAAQFDVK